MMGVTELDKELLFNFMNRFSALVRNDIFIAPKPNTSPTWCQTFGIGTIGCSLALDFGNLALVLWPLLQCCTKKCLISSLVFPEETTRLSYFFEWFYLCLSCFLHVYTYRYTIIVLNKLILFNPSMT